MFQILMALFFTSSLRWLTCARVITSFARGGASSVVVGLPTSRFSSQATSSMLLL